MIKHQNKSAGFTIIELLIATAIFAVVLVVLAVGVLQFSRMYYKGVTEATTQDTARNITDVISQAIQFSGGDVTTTTPVSTPGDIYAFCVGNQQFSFTTGYQLSDNPDSAKFQTPHALVLNSVSGCAGAGAQDVRQATVQGRELLGPNMRLAKLVVTGVGVNLYRVDVRIVYGDDDLLQNPTSATSACINATAGTQYCSVSDLSTVVTKRVE